MTADTLEILEKKIREKTDSFIKLWDETPEINRVVFNNKMEQIQRSCIIERRIRRLVKEGKDSKKALEKIRKQNGIYGLVFLLFLVLFQYVPFLQSEVYQSSSPQERVAVALIIGGFLTTVFLLRDLTAWIDLNFKKSKIDIVQLLPDNLHVESGFYKFFVEDNEDETAWFNKMLTGDFSVELPLRDEFEHEKIKLGLLESKERLLIQINDNLKTSNLLYDR
ncbi:hypothetical protein MCEREM21A_02419 [Sphingomonadaceae bacterium]